MVHLETITKNNWLDAISLRVREDQAGFVASNAISLAQLNFLEKFHAKGIFLHGEMIGFTLYGVDEEDNEYWIYRMMIDQKHQGKGYGVKSIQLIIDDIKMIKEEHHHTITLSYEPENQHAKHVYEKLGFQDVEGLINEGEQVMRFTF
ncbi:GNAT family N-acetyltransferase [Oceanobacillus sp. FSL K6-2867]|uniref:GNAT family N-acetyltransferase n=1 Tax=Oceanobacillus sp. FSL K6-2867 TaxID=2954748 RepID=UPI0030D98E98